LNRKILWLTYRDCTSSVREAKEKMEEAKAAHKQKADELKEDDRPLVLLENKVENLKSERDAANRALNQSVSALVSSHSNSVERAKQELDEAVERKAELVNESQERSKKLQTLKQASERLKKEVAEIPQDPPPELIEKEEALKNQVKVLWSNVLQVDDEVGEARDKVHSIQVRLPPPVMSCHVTSSNRLIHLHPSRGSSRPFKPNCRG
jgi:chromosome segregation ATPase